MSITALTLGEVRVHESRYDPAKGTDDATRWHIGTLDSKIMGKIKDKATTLLVDPAKPDDEIQTSVNMEAVNWMTVQFGVPLWENFVDKNGDEVEYRTKKHYMGGKSYRIVHDDAMSLIPLAVIRELADEIRSSNELDEEGEGNSDEQS